MLELAVSTLLLVILAFEAPSVGQSPECVARGRSFGPEAPGSSPGIFVSEIASTQHHDDWMPVVSRSGSRLYYSSKRPTEGKGEKSERSRVVGESNPPAIWNLDLFEDRAIEEKADR